MAFSCLEAIKDTVTTLKYTSGWIPGVERAIAGYREDQLPTTHAIRAEIPNTSLASTIFDRITYNKGLMTLKQLSYIMGADNFFKGVDSYFSKFGHSNGTINDFIG